MQVQAGTAIRSKSVRETQGIRFVQMHKVVPQFRRHTPKLMTQTRLKLSWISANAAFGVGVYLALFTSHSWAQTVVVGFVWITLSLYVVVLMSSESRAKYFQKPQPVPQIIGRICDVLFTAAFVSAGWYVTALAYVLSCAVLAAIHGEIWPTQSDFVATDHQDDRLSQLSSSAKVLGFLFGLLGLIASGYIQTKHSEERDERIEEIAYRNLVLNAHLRFSPDTNWAKRLRASVDDPLLSLIAAGSLNKLRQEWLTGKPIVFAGLLRTLENSTDGMATRSFRIRAEHSLLGQLSAPLVSNIRVEVTCPDIAVTKLIRKSSSKIDSYGVVLTLIAQDVRSEAIAWNEQTGSTLAPFATGHCLQATIVSDIDLIGILDSGDSIPSRYSIAAMTLLLLSGVAVLLSLIDRRPYSIN